MMHRVVFSDLAQAACGSVVSIAGQEGYHAATVKRVRIGDRVGVIDGVGHRGEGRLSSISGHKTRPTIEIEIGEIESVPRSASEVEVWTALPKGDRLETMIDQLSQIGVSRWRPLICDRSERKWEAVKREKIERVVQESAKQCDRAWFLGIGEPIAFEDAIGSCGVVVADGIGERATTLRADGTTRVVLIGPEGGWSEPERARIAEQSVTMVRVGGHVLRLETAAIAAGTVFVNLQCEE